MPRRPGKQHELRACLQCAKGKLKCVPDELDSNKCQRCSRLRKDCTPQSQSRASSPARAHRSSAEPPPSAAPAPAAISPRSPSDEPAARESPSGTFGRPRPYGPVEATSALNTNPNSFVNPYRSPERYPPGKPWSQVPLSSILDADIRLPVDREADALVEIYRHQFSEYFPFVIVPQASGSALRQKRPFLLKAVSMVASGRDNNEAQNRLGSEILEEISNRVVVGGEKSLDMLQGLLLYIAWYHCHVSGSAHITILVQLAIGLLFDLGLQKPTDSDERVNFNFDSTRRSDGLVLHTESRTLEQKRALLGCYYLSALISTTFKKIESMEYTSYIDGCCEVLLATKEHPFDAYIVRLTRLQSIVAKIPRSFPGDIWPDGMIRAPVAMHVQEIERELRDFRAALPADLKHSRSFTLHQHTANMYVHEVGLFTRAWRGRHGPEFSKRLDMLFSCLESAKLFLEAFMDIPVECLHRQPYFVWVNVVVGVVISARLTFLECNGWDLAYVRDHLNLSKILENLLRYFQEAAEFAQRDGYSFDDCHIMSRLAVHIMRVKKWYEAEVANGLVRSQEQQQRYSLAGLGDTARNSSGQIVDEGFWDNVMSMWEMVQS